MTHEKQIEKGVEMPVKKGRKKPSVYNSKYPWRLCTEINDSFIPTEKDKEKVREAAKKFRQRNPEFKFLVDYDFQGNLRVWRVENDKKNS